MTRTDGDADAAERLECAGRGMLLAWWARRRPSVPAIVAPAGDRTFAELNARANQLVRALRRLGLEAGDGVALLCPNRAEFAEVGAACQRAGWRLTTVNWHLTAAEAGYIVDNCEAKALVADVSLASVALGALRHAHACRVALAVGGDIDGFVRYDSELAGESGADIEDPVLGSSMLYTSGTTGRPKGVHRPDTPPPTSINLFGYRDGDRHLCTGPLYHAAPLAFSLTTPIAHGVGVVLMERWDADDRARPGRVPCDHPHAHGADDVPSASLVAARGAGNVRPVHAALGAPRGRPLPGAGEAAPDRVARAGGVGVLRRHGGFGLLRRLGDLARQTRHRRQARRRSGDGRRRPTGGRCPPARRASST